VLEFIKGCRFVFKDFIEIGIPVYTRTSFDPVGKSLGNKAQVPVPFNPVDMPDLIVVKVKGIL